MTTDHKSPVVSTRARAGKPRKIRAGILPLFACLLLLATSACFFDFGRDHPSHDQQHLDQYDDEQESHDRDDRKGHENRHGQEGVHENVQQGMPAHPQHYARNECPGAAPAH
jgi:hypothetical protein